MRWGIYFQYKEVFIFIYVYAYTCLMVVVWVIVVFYGTVTLFHIALYIAIFHLTLILLEEQFPHILKY